MFIMLIVFTFELKSSILRAITAFGSSIIFVLILVSASRGAFLGSIAGILFYLFLRFRAGRLPLIPLLLIGIVGSTLALQTDMGEQMLDRFFVGKDRQRIALVDDARVSLIRTSAALIKENPLLGIGFSETNFMIKNKEYNYEGYLLEHPHNSYLEMWVFGGTLTLMGLLLVVLHLLRPIRHALKKTSSDPFLMAVSAALFGMSINFGTGRTFFIESVSHLFFMLLAGTFFYARYLLLESNLEIESVNATNDLNTG